MESEIEILNKSKELNQIQYNDLTYDSFNYINHLKHSI